ncbi:large ribosomal subunit protein mL64 [Malaya genurostris]|uniref:large ribosomal subunit protein mL64 n=1 Tax=Malaya genurostris TaxID=325434 RepID=UPI0026F3A7BA|nr:large ribosomal subunit protein mL64 [Malaya genurostris]
MLLQRLSSIFRCKQQPVFTYLRPFRARLYASSSISSTTIAPEDPIEDEQQPITFIDDENLQADREAQIEKLRNKSRLLPQHRNMLHGQLPYEESQSWIHDTVKYKRMMLGRYGTEGSKVDPRISFPTKREMLEKSEYERVAFPFSLQEMMVANQKARNDKTARIRAREVDIAKKIEKLDQWTADLNARIAKKEADAKAAKERKERLVEEVRRHFGFKVDPREERFQEMLAQKEKEDRKKVKEAKRKEKEEKMMEKLKKRTEDIQNDEKND